MPKGANLSRDLFHRNLDVAIFQTLSTHNIANCVLTLALDTDQDEVCIVLTWSGAGTGTFSIQYQLPGNFQTFKGKSTDLSLCSEWILHSDLRDYFTIIHQMVNKEKDKVNKKLEKRRIALEGKNRAEQLIKEYNKNYPE